MYDVDDYLNVLKDILWSEKLNGRVYTTTYQEEITYRTVEMNIIEKEGYVKRGRICNYIYSLVIGAAARTALIGRRMNGGRKKNRTVKLKAGEMNTKDPWVKNTSYIATTSPE